MHHATHVTIHRNAGRKRQAEQVNDEGEADTAEKEDGGIPPQSSEIPVKKSKATSELPLLAVAMVRLDGSGSR